jgi:pre-mRNA-processing factor 17
MRTAYLCLAEKYFAAQSLDNQILIYSTDNFRQNRKKRFAGHSVAGYACQVGFSPDGKWISSGDGEGNVVFWDWKTGRIKSRLRAHSKVVIAHEWLPHETVGVRGVNHAPMLTESLLTQSKVITASWDGLIKLWVRDSVFLCCNLELRDVVYRINLCYHHVYIINGVFPRAPIQNV